MQIPKECLTIETGIFIYESDISKLKERLSLANKFNCYHFILTGDALLSYNKFVDVIKNTVKACFSISIYLDNSLINNRSVGEKKILHFLEEIIYQFGPSSTIILSHELFCQNSIETESELTNVLIKMVPVLEKNKTILCVENCKDDCSYRFPEKILKVINDINSRNIRFSLNMNNLEESSIDLSEYIEIIYANVESVSYRSGIQKDYSGLYSTIYSIFHLPYKQRPFFIMDREYAALERTLSKFWKIVIGNDLLYK